MIAIYQLPLNGAHIDILRVEAVGSVYWNKDDEEDTYGCYQFDVVMQSGDIWTIAGENSTSRSDVLKSPLTEARSNIISAWTGAQI